MMAPRRVVLVLEAERLLIPKRESKAADEELARLEAFIQSPSPHATVVFVCGSLDMRRRISKTLAREAQVVDCGTIEDAADAERWIKARAARDKVPLDAGGRPGARRARRHEPGAPARRPRARGAVCDGAADDLGRRRAAVGARRARISSRTSASPTPSGRATPARRCKQLGAALDAGAAPFFVLGQLRFVAERTPGPRLRDAVGAVFRTDLALKSSGGDQKLLLERLVVELCGESAAGRARRRPGALERGRAARRTPAGGPPEGGPYFAARSTCDARRDL